MNNDWVENLKAGDKVIVVERNCKSIKTVSRVTKTQVMILVRKDYEDKYNKKSKFLIGLSTWNVNFIEEATEEAIKELKQQAENSRIRQWFKDRKFTFEEIKKIKELIGE